MYLSFVSFISAWRTPFSISYREGLLVINSIVLFIWEYNNFSFIFEGWFCLLYNYLVTVAFLSALWICQPTAFWTLDPSYVMSHLSLAAFKFFFVFVLWQLIMMCLGVVIFECLFSLDFAEFLGCVDLYFHKIWEVFSPVTLCSYSRTFILSMLGYLVVYHKSLRVILFSFFFSFFLVF